MELSRLCAKLEQLLSDICFSGFKNVSPALMNRLAEIRDLMETAGMRKGADLVGAFQEDLAGYQRKEVPIKDTVYSFCALEFYQKNIDGNLWPALPEKDTEI